MKIDEISAPPDWRCVDFISDLHLQASESANFLAWQKYLAHSPADAVFILGDLFELWVGDDAAMDALSADTPEQRFEQQCGNVLRECSKHRKLYFMPGNRDFLIGERFAKACGMQILRDPSVLAFGDERYLLSHGDSLCIADEPYQKFRAMVRDTDWQAQFLATPVEDRLQRARAMRTTSLARQNEQNQAKQERHEWIDIDQPTAVRWMNAARAKHFVHGHTHEGRDHPISSSQGDGTRHVLPDWQVSAIPLVGYALRLSGDSTGTVRTHHVPVS